MNSDAEKFWDEVSGKLRRFKRFQPLTPKEAEAELVCAPDDRLTSGQIDSIVEAVTSGELASWEPLPTLDWTNEFNTDEVNDEVLQLNRNRGDDDPDTARLEEELRQELLSDDENEED